MFLKQNPGWYGKKLKYNTEALSAGEISLIPWIFCVFAEKHDPSKMAAAKALLETLNTLSFNDIIRIDEQMRQTTSMEWFINWHNFKLNDFFTPGMSDDERLAICIFASFNPNGFIRENAVRKMKDFDGTLPYIILRQNDWVLQVRQAASEAFSHRLRRLSDGEILAALPFAEKLKLGGRDSHSEHTKQFFSVLTAPEHIQDLLSGLKNANIRTRKICIEALFSVFPLKTEFAFKRLLCEPDPFLRATIFRKLSVVGENMDDVSNVFLRDKYPANRMLAFQYLLDANAENICDIAEKLLLDKNALVRRAAQNIMQEKIPNYRFREFYLNSLNLFPMAAIYGLGEKGLQSDVSKIDPYLDDSRIGVVKSAMVSLMRLNGEKYNPVVTEMLNDDRPGVAKVASNLVLKSGSPDYGRIREIYSEAKYKHTKQKCMDVLFTASKWPRLIYMLEAMQDNEEQIKKKALDAIIRWLFSFNRSFSLPSNTQVDRIRKLVDGLNGVLSDKIQRELLFVLPR